MGGGDCGWKISTFRVIRTRPLPETGEEPTCAMAPVGNTASPCAWSCPGCQVPGGPGRAARGQLYVPWVFLSASSRKGTSLWIRSSLPRFPIPRSRRTVRESLRVSLQVGPLLKMIPKQENDSKQSHHCQHSSGERGAGALGTLRSAGRDCGPTPTGPGTEPGSGSGGPSSALGAS